MVGWGEAISHFLSPGKWLQCKAWKQRRGASGQWPDVRMSSRQIGRMLTCLHPVPRQTVQMLTCTGLPFCAQESSGSFYAHKLFWSLPALWPHFTDEETVTQGLSGWANALSPVHLPVSGGLCFLRPPRNEHRMRPAPVRLMPSVWDHRFCSEEVLAGGRNLREDTRCPQGSCPLSWLPLPKVPEHLFLPLPAARLLAFHSSCPLFSASSPGLPPSCVPSGEKAGLGVES